MKLYLSKYFLLLIIVAGLILVSGIDFAYASNPKSPQKSNGCFISTSRPVQYSNGTLVSQAAFRCEGAYEFIGLPSFKVCIVRQYKSWRGWKEKTVKCSFPQFITSNGDVQSVAASCHYGEGNYYTEARWREGTALDFIAVVGGPPASLGQLAVDQLTGYILGHLPSLNGNRQFRHPSWFVCT